jgi:LysR family hydrogen peroxide-inducible transcriptional activator
MDPRPHPYTLRQLQYAVAVADLRSFRRAAEACHVSQPALSAQLAQLEDALGVVLFARDRRGVLPTPAGTLLLERMRGLVVDGHALTDAARRATDPLAGPLRLGVIPTIAPYLLPTLTPALRAAFPALVALWTEDKTPALVERLAAGTLDAALLALEADLGTVEHAVVGVDPFVLATPADHPLAHGDGPVPIAALQDEPVLLLDEGHCFRSQALALCSRVELREQAFRATSLPTLVQMVAAGAGVTLLPGIAAIHESAHAAIVVRPLAEPVPHRTIVLAWRERSPVGPALRRLAEAFPPVEGPARPPG